MFETALEEDEIIISVGFPVAEKAAYMKFENPASRYAIVGPLFVVLALAIRHLPREARGWGLIAVSLGIIGILSLPSIALIFAAPLIKPFIGFLPTEAGVSAFTRYDAGPGPGVAADYSRTAGQANAMVGRPSVAGPSRPTEWPKMMLMAAPRNCITALPVGRLAW